MNTDAVTRCLRSLTVLFLCVASGRHGAAAAAPGAGAGAPCASLHIGDVVVATVREVSTYAATHGRPPRVVLGVHEVLRGDLEADRSRAVWEPPLHDIDYGDVEKNPRYQAWKATPMAGPKVGDKMILWGRLVASKEAKEFRVFAWARFPYSDQKRAWALDLIRQHAEAERAREAEKRAKERALAEKKAQWRAKVSAEEIQRYAKEADFVAIGRIVSGGDGGTQETPLDLEVREVLKGQKHERYAGNRYFVQVVVPGRVCALLDRRTPYLLFLSEKGMEFTPSVPRHPRIHSGDGIVIADEAAVKAARAAIGAAPQPSEQPPRSH